MVLFVSLGFDCYVTWTLRRCFLQTYGSLPFDWINTYKYSSLSNFLCDGSLAIKRLSESIYDPPQPTILIHSDYNLRFPHEYDAFGKVDTNNIFLKYQRRFDRLKNLSNLATHTYLIRQVAPAVHDQNPESFDDYFFSIPRVSESFRNFFQHDKFSILLMSSTNFFKELEQDYFLKNNICTLNNVKSFTNGYLHAESLNDWNHKFFKYYYTFFNGLSELENNSHSLINSWYSRVFEDY